LNPVFDARYTEQPDLPVARYIELPVAMSSAQFRGTVSEGSHRVGCCQGVAGLATTMSRPGTVMVTVTRQVMGGALAEFARLR
jgi:hypothetical protein